MKIAISGKGGVGKTTLAALLAHHYARAGRPVLAIDADPSPCLGPALGFSAEALASLSPIAELKQLIAERTGTEPGSYGQFFKLNPKVNDLPDRFSVEREGIRLLLLGAVEQGGSGCYCAPSAVLKQLVTHVLIQRQEVVLLDLYAGVEHLGRATADSVDTMLVVSDATRRSVQTAHKIHKLATDIGLQRVLLVGSKVRDDEDVRFLTDEAGDLPLLGWLPHTDHAIPADRQGKALYGEDPQLADRIAELAAALEG